MSYWKIPWEWKTSIAWAQKSYEEEEDSASDSQQIYWKWTRIYVLNPLMFIWPIIVDASKFTHCPHFRTCSSPLAAAKRCAFLRTCRKHTHDAFIIYSPGEIGCIIPFRPARIITPVRFIHIFHGFKKMEKTWRFPMFESHGVKRPWNIKKKKKQ